MPFHELINYTSTTLVATDTSIKEEKTLMTLRTKNHGVARLIEAISYSQEVASQSTCLPHITTSPGLKTLKIHYGNI